MKKRLIKIAHQIVALEKELQENPNLNYLKQFDRIIRDMDLTPADMLEIDAYIQEKKLLTK